jgi:hypothetical protein
MAFLMWASLGVLLALGWAGAIWLIVGLVRDLAAQRRAFEAPLGRVQVGITDKKEPPAGVWAPPRG